MASFLKPLLLVLATTPLLAAAGSSCQLTDPGLTLQSYRADPQHERIAMYWRQANGKDYGSLRALLADGAMVRVCGSRPMASAVTEVLDTIAATLGISSAMRPIFDGITKASA